MRDYGDVVDEAQGDDTPTTTPTTNTANGGADDEVADVGPDGERNFNTVLTYNRRLSSRVGQVLRDGRLCVTLGGDHSIAIGTIHGHAHSNPGHQVTQSTSGKR